jgi:hypothetical protein
LEKSSRICVFWPNSEHGPSCGFHFRRELVPRGDPAFYFYSSAHARESTRLSCAAVTGPQTTLDPEQMKEWTPNSTYGGHAFGLGTFAEFLAAREKILPLIADYSPYALVSSDDPAVYMTFGAPPAIGQDQKDPTHSANFGVKLAEHYAAKGVSADVHYRGVTDVKHDSPRLF